MKKPIIYFAGKCNNGNHEGRHDWRTSITESSVVCSGLPGRIQDDIVVLPGFIYGGPFVIDDHVWYNSELAMACSRQIARCDAVFAWIDAVDCYGTLFELGFARGLRKPVFLYRESGLSYNQYAATSCGEAEHWLCAALCTYVGEASGPKFAFDDFMQRYAEMQILGGRLCGS